MTDATLTHGTVNCDVEFETRSFESSPSRRSKRNAAEPRRNRAHRLLTTEIAYIPNKSFHNQRRAEELARLAAGETSPAQERTNDEVLNSLPSHLARLCETALLTPDQERLLFQQMNFLKYQANVLRSRLDPETASDSELDEIEGLLDRAREVRDRIVKANMRLVMSVVKKFVTSRDSFDEMLSDGIVTLMSTVDKFDYGRGFRFSTYAYRAIARNAFHTISGNRRKQNRFVNNAEQIDKVPGREPETAAVEDAAPTLHSALLELIDHLDRREQLIIKARYCLGTNEKTPTFEVLGNRLGVSKERVRQLEARAIEKLRQAAEELHLDDLFESTLR